MLEKLKQNSVNLNLNKAVTIFIVVSIVLASVSFMVIYSILKDENIECGNIVELNREKEADYEQENGLGLKGESM